MTRIFGNDTFGSLAGDGFELARRAVGRAGSVATLVVASVAALGLAYIVPGGAAPVMTDATPIGSIERAPAIWTLSDDLAGTTCEARRGARLSRGDHALELAAACKDVFGPLADAVIWREGRDGTVSLADPAGRTLLAFMPADGPKMEAIEPRSAMISLERP